MPDDRRKTDAAVTFLAAMIAGPVGPRRREARRDGELDDDFAFGGRDPAQALRAILAQEAAAARR